MSEENLSPKDYLDLAIEVGIGSIPVIGSAVQTLYFGAQNEKRFKRIEQFYRKINAIMQQLEPNIPKTLNPESKDQLIGIIETIHSEIEKSKSKDKTIYFVNAYKNLLLCSNKNVLDLEELYTEILSSLTKIEIDLLAIYFRNKRAVGRPELPGVDELLVIGSMNRLSDFGLVNKHLEKIVIGGGGAETYSYSISNLGISFCQYILT